MSLRLMPLQSRYQEMKHAYYEEAARQGFKQYRSPWVPVHDSNRHLVRPGDLVISNQGLEAPCEVGRDVVRIEDDGIKAFVKKIPTAQEAEFVWVDHRSVDAAPYLAGNPGAGAYKEYTKIMKSILRQADQKGAQLIGPAQFPLFHETSVEYAQNILSNGLDISRIWVRQDQIFGKGIFCAGVDQPGVKNKGNFNGAFVRFIAAEGAVPRWLLYQNLWYEANPWPASVRCGGPYNWRIAAAELSASAIKMGTNVFIFDSFEQYQPAEIIVEAGL